MKNEVVDGIRSREEELEQRLVSVISGSVDNIVTEQLYDIREEVDKVKASIAELNSNSEATNKGTTNSVILGDLVAKLQQELSNINDQQNKLKSELKQEQSLIQQSFEQQIGQVSATIASQSDPELQKMQQNIQQQVTECISKVDFATQ